MRQRSERRRHSAPPPRRTALKVGRVVQPALRKEGEPLPPQLRSTMEARFGQGFGDVRLHTDPEANASALALGASAYSVGRDIVFSPGTLQPNTRDGERLLAHELAHVASSPGGNASVEPSRVASPSSSEERQAERAADAAMAGRPIAPAARAAQPGVVHRSLLGAGIGGGIGALVGGVGLGLLGSLLGPAGAVAGAIIGGLGGLIAGAIIGDRASRRERGLSQEERAYAHEIYHDAVDYDAIRITRGAALSAGAARTLGNTINLQDEHFKGDTMELSEAGMLVLIHEMGHVWQYQNGGLAYIPSSLIPQIVAAAQGQSRNAAYDWRNAVRNHIDWADWNAEQQAECISDYNEALRRINANNGTLADFETVTLAEPYIERVRERSGAPGSRRRSTAPSPQASTGEGGTA
jgi:uncharacterized protein DUF4157